MSLTINQTSGVIFWFDSNDNQKDMFHYWHVVARRKVMDKWRLSAKEGDYFQIIPRIYDSNISKPIKDKSKEPIVRHPAKYDNPQWDDY